MENIKEDRIKEIEDRNFEIIQTEEKKKNEKVKKVQMSIGHYKINNRTTGIPEIEEIEWGRKFI